MDAPGPAPYPPRVRVLAVDFGERRIGLAFAETDLGVGVAVGTVPRESDEKACRRIASEASGREVELLLVGEPRRTDGSESPLARRVRGFAARLEAATGLPVTFHPETLTSVEAERDLRQAGVRGRQRKESTDAEAAAVLLRDWMEAGGAGYR